MTTKRTNELHHHEIEGRLNALREVLALVAGTLPAQSRAQISGQLAALQAVADGQEDPGAVGGGAFAVEGARAKEIQTLKSLIDNRPPDPDADMAEERTTSSDRLEEGLEDSFPASDPVAVTQTSVTRRPDPKSR